MDYSEIAWLEQEVEQGHTLDVEKTPTATSHPGYHSIDWTGEKYPGGLGPADIFKADYWTLREQSSRLFRENLYARGLIRRLTTNIVHVGLHPESMAEEQVLGMESGALDGWKEQTERRFDLYANTPQVCDYESNRTFGQIQKYIYREAIVSGDVLVVLHISRTTKLPQIQVINGAHVQTPVNTDDYKIVAGRTIEHGVELDSRKRQRAYWVRLEDNTFKRVPAWGARSGRRVAWLYYGTDKRLDDVRGEPMLSLVLQSLKEVDRYRDAAQRKATLNSILAMFIKKTKPKMGTKPLTGGALRKREITPATSDTDRRFSITDYLPGMYIEELQEGEEPTPHSTAGTDVNFAPFEEAVINACAWSNGVPPTIYRLGFSRNYGASQGEINEFKIFQTEQRVDFGGVNCSPVWQEWMLSMVLKGQIQAPGLLAAWRDLAKFEQFTAWVFVDWAGAVKPAMDLLKLVKAYEVLVDRGWITNDLAARELTGTKFSKNVKRLATEIKMLSEARGEGDEGAERAGNALASIQEVVNG